MRYAPTPFGRWLVLGIFAVLAVVAVGLVVATIVESGSDLPVLFTMLWLAALAWCAYWWLFRISTELRITGSSELQWSTPLRRGRIPLDALTEIRPARFASNVAIFETDTGPSVIVLAAKGLREFTDEIARRQPHVSVRLGWQARLAERLPGWKGLRRR